MSDLNDSSSDSSTTKTNSPFTQTTGVVEVLDREKGLKDWITPTGRQVSLHQRGSLFEFKLEGVGSQPKETETRYTSLMRVQKAINDYLTSFWDMSDAISKKRKN